MKGIQVQADSGHSILYNASLPDPVPSSDQLLIKVLASPINPSDALNATGAFPYTTFPRIPGRDFAGIVVKAPPDSTVPVGAEVFGTSGPAAAVGVPYSTAWLALKRTQAKAGETVLVVGASGAVGFAVMQIAKQLGCNVIGAARNDEAEVDLRKDPELKTVKERLTPGGKGADVCVDAVGSTDIMPHELKALGVNGRWAFISTAHGDPVLSVNLKEVYRQNQMLVGCNSLVISQAEMASALTQLAQWFDSGELEAPKEAQFTKVSIEELAKAYEDTISNKAGRKKFVVEFDR
ncbi:hypothetical protein DV736_g5792, partial [Chaetothyriales sp. CBS 134916]